MFSFNNKVNNAEKNKQQVHEWPGREKKMLSNYFETMSELVADLTDLPL
jgi:hypothetical protein